MHVFVPAVGKPLAPAVPEGLGCDDVYERAIGAGFGWRNSTVYKLGASYEWSKDLVLRAGYATLKQPIPASQTLFNIVAPGVVEDHLTLGATWSYDGNKELSIAYMHAFEKKVNGAGSMSALGGGEANLKMYQDSLGVAWGWKY